jgi:PAS domain S-box-containing protein
MWNVSEEITEGQNSARLFKYLLSRVKDSSEFDQIMNDINASPGRDSYDTFTLKEGQVFRLYSQPQMTGSSIMGRVWSFRDITLRNRAEMELRAAYEQISAAEEQLKQQYNDLTKNTALIRESEERLRTFTEVIPDGIGICIEGDIVEANDQLAALFGLTVPELLGREIFDFIAPEWHARIREQMSSGSLEHSELQVKRTDEAVIPVELRGRSIGYRGRAAWASVWRDLSERIRTQRTLEESEAKYRNVFMAENNPLLLIEQKTMTIQDVNDAACQTYGYFRNEFIGKNVLDLCSEPEKVLHDIQRMRPGIRRYHHMRKDGKVFPAEVSTAFFILDSRPVFIYSVLDLTHAKLIEDALKLANIKLNLLLGITRHDILNKVSVLMGYNELLSQRISDPHIGNMLENQNKAILAIRTQIEFTREYEDLGGKALRWQMVKEIISRTYDQFLKTVPMTCDLGDLEIYADPMIEKVFYNLFDNAFRYGEGIGTIKISSVVAHEELTIFFEDDGKGVPVEEKEKIFCQGYGKNTGLGLFLSREILSITSMSIRESGEYLKGARFEIRVPAEFFRVRGNDEKSRVSGDDKKTPLSSA